MTDDEIKALAEEVGFVAYGEDLGEFRVPASAMLDRLGRFARLCIAHGLEMGAEVYSQPHAEYFGRDIADTMRDMAAEIRK